MTQTSVDALVKGDPMQAPVQVVGARGSFERAGVIDAIDKATEGQKAVVQAFRADAVYGDSHLEAAARRALRSHAQGRGIARDVAVEIALYAAGTTQIEDALDLVGLPADGEALVVAGVGPDRDAVIEDVLGRLDLVSSSDVVQASEQALDRLGIAKAARERVAEGALPLLVQEHVALLDARS